MCSTFYSSAITIVILKVYVDIRRVLFCIVLFFKAQYLDGSAVWILHHKQRAIYTRGIILWYDHIRALQSRQVILNFSSFKNQYKQQPLIFGFFFNSLMELY